MTFVEKDLFVLVKIFFNTELPVFVLDPGKECYRNCASGFIYVENRSQVMELARSENRFILINISGANISGFPFDFSKMEGILSFDQVDEMIEGFTHYQLFYINDVRCRIRYLVSSGHMINDFLNELEESRTVIDMNNLFSLYKDILNYFRLRSGKLAKITDGQFQIWKRGNSLFPELKNKDWNSFSANFHKNLNKGIVTFKLYHEKLTRGVFKVSFEQKGFDLISQEFENLTFIRGAKLNILIPPEFRMGNTSLLFLFESDRMEMDYYQTARQMDKIIMGLNEIYALSHFDISIKGLLKKEDILKNLSLAHDISRKGLFPQGISNINITRLLNLITSMLDDLNLEQRIPVSVFLDNLIPEYMAFGKENIILYNWESVRYDKPMLFDLFSYAFRHIEGFENPDVYKLIREIKRIRKSLSMTSILENYDINFDVHLKLYLIYRSVDETNALLNKRIARPEENLKFYLWYEFAEKLIHLEGI